MVPLRHLELWFSADATWRGLTANTDSIRREHVVVAESTVAFLKPTNA
jgi:hypothetical protein